MIRKIKQFLEEAKQELSKVVWPSREQTVRLTLAVILISTLVALYLTLLDYVFSGIIKSAVGSLS